MSLFDLFFLFSALATIIVWLTALASLLAGRRARAAGILRVWAVAALLYAAADIASHRLMALRVLHPGDPQCSDDWCAVVEKAGRDDPASDIYRVNLRVYSRALRVEQRERGLEVYLADAGGRRYHPIPEPGETPFDVLLGPGEGKEAVRSFRVPLPVRHLDLFLVKTGEGFPIESLIIGRSPFQRTAVRLD